MKAYDMHENKEIEVTYDDLIDFLNNNRQIDLTLKAPVTDADGYLTWDKENWINIDGRKYQRNYFLGDRALRDCRCGRILGRLLPHVRFQIRQCRLRQRRSFGIREEQGVVAK